MSGRLWPALLPALLLLAGAAGAAEYEVGPGRELAGPEAVPWEALAPGDRVLIHWRPAPYLVKWVLCRRGTAERPIVVSGVAGPDGQLPVIDGRDARTPEQLNFWNGNRGVIKIGGANRPADCLPAWIVLENLEVRGARPPFGFHGRDGRTEYAKNAAAVYIEKGEHLTVRNCVLSDCGNGLFVGPESSEILIESCHIHGNGNEGSAYEHNSYTAAAGITFQFNRYGPLRAGCGGNALKDRSAGLVVRANWIEGGNRQLDLVDAEDRAALRDDPRYRRTFVYGNILIEPDGDGNSQIVHYGGDSGRTEWYRKGVLYFYHNTVVSRRRGNTTLFRLSTNDERVECLNNIVFAAAGGRRLALLAGAGQLRLAGNWLSAGWRDCHGEFGGELRGREENDGGDRPGFVDEAGGDFALAPDAPARGPAAPLPPETESRPVDAQYVRHRRGEERRAATAPGARE